MVYCLREKTEIKDVIIGMRRKRILAGLLLAAMLAAVTVCGQAELRLNETKKGGKVVRREWLDESGALTNGPEGYA